MKLDYKREFISGDDTDKKVLHKYDSTTWEHRKVKRSKYEWLWEWLGAISIVALVWFLVLF